MYNLMEVFLDFLRAKVGGNKGKKAHVCFFKEISGKTYQNKH